MRWVNTLAGLPEEKISAHIDALAVGPRGSDRLAALMREDHVIYDQRSAAAVVRLRGWVLLALARAGVRDDTLLFVLEEFDTAHDPFLVAAAARALRSYPEVKSAFAPFVVRALRNMIGRDHPVSFERYGEYLLSAASGTSPIRELLAALKWLGPRSRHVLPEIEAMRTAAFPARLLPDLEQIIEVIRAGSAEDCVCCDLPAGLRRVVTWSGTRLPFRKPIVFEDQDGERIGFDDIFTGHRTIVVFFYTRCDNPLKCSLTIARLGRVQKLLEERGLASRIHTAAITYDPTFDLPRQMRTFGERRGLTFNTGNRMLRVIAGMGSLQRRFQLGVNFVASIVNRHRLEAYILDDRGQVVYSFERLHCSEAELVDRARLLEADHTRYRSVPATETAGAIAAIAFAVFPKCPICWAGYLSVLGVAGLERIPYASWIEPALAAVALINLASIWMRARITRRMTAPFIVTAGLAMIGVSRFGLPLAGLGTTATLAGSVLSALGARARPMA